MYKAIRRDGPQHFHVLVIEETDKSDEREAFWIQCLETVTNGYNVSFGGKGKRLCDQDYILFLWEQGYSLKEIGDLTHHDTGQISVILKSRGVTGRQLRDRYVKKLSMPVEQIDLRTGDVIAIHSSVSEAARSIGDVRRNTSISRVCRGLRQSAFGYGWRYVMI